MTHFHRNLIDSESDLYNSMLSVSLNIAYRLILDVIIDATIADEGAAAVGMARHGADDIRIL